MTWTGISTIGGRPVRLSYTPAEVTKIIRQTRDETEVAIGKWLQHRTHSTLYEKEALVITELANEIVAGEYRDT